MTEKSDGLSLLTIQDGHRRPKCDVYGGEEKRRNTCPRIAVIKFPLTSYFCCSVFHSNLHNFYFVFLRVVGSCFVTHYEILNLGLEDFIDRSQCTIVKAKHIKHST